MSDARKGAARPADGSAEPPENEMLRMTDTLCGVVEMVGLGLESLCDRNLLDLLDQLPHPFYIKDRQGRFLLANREALRMMGVDDPGTVYGLTSFDFLDARTAAAIEALERGIVDGGEAFVDLEFERPAASTVPGWTLVTKAPLRNAAGEIVGVMSLGRDITGRKREEFLRRGHATLLEMIARGEPLSDVLEALLRLIEAQMSGIRASILFYDAESGKLHCGAAPSLPEDYTKLIDGLPIGQGAGSCGTAAYRRAPVVVADTFSDPLWRDYAHIVRRFGLRSCWSTPIADAHGTLFGTFALYSSTVREPSGIERELTAMATDLAGIAIARARAEERIRHMAHHDALTGLPNRLLFRERFARLIDTARLEGGKAVAAYIDLDNFKTINDGFGHGAGDALLKEIAARLSRGVRASDLAVRLGGDEFALVLVADDGGEDALLRRLADIRADICRPLALPEATLAATCSMGVAVFPRDGDTPEALLASADAAMYRAKELGRNLMLEGGTDPSA